MTGSVEVAGESTVHKSSKVVVKMSVVHGCKKKKKNT